MASVRIWTPESDYDSKAVCCIAKKIVEYYDSNIRILESSKEAFNQAARLDKLKQAVDNYLKESDLVIFLLDTDGVQAQAKRRQEPNSLFNRIIKVVEQSQGKALLILMRQELEAWLLVDCIGICCYYTRKREIRSDREWVRFAKKHQLGKTDLIAEAESGGKNAKEDLEKFSHKILKKINPNLKDRDLKERQYSEPDSYKIANYIETGLTHGWSETGFFTEY